MTTQHSGDIRGTTIIKLKDSLYGYVRAVEARLPGPPGLLGDLAYPLPSAANNLPYLPIGHIRVEKEQVLYLISGGHLFFSAEGRTKRSYVCLALAKAEHPGATHRTDTLGCRPTILHDYRLRLLHLPLGVAFDTVSLHLLPPLWTRWSS